MKNYVIQKMQNLNLSKQKFLLKIQKLNLKMLKLKKPRKYLRKFSWIDAQKKALRLWDKTSLTRRIFPVFFDFEFIKHYHLV